MPSSTDPSTGDAETLSITVQSEGTAAGALRQELPEQAEEINSLQRTYLESDATVTRSSEISQAQSREPRCTLPSPAQSQTRAQIPHQRENSSPSAQAQDDNDDDPPPQLELWRDVKSVELLLREWKGGLGGRSSVEAMGQRWGAAWRSTTEERTYHYAQKVIIDEVRRRATASGRAEEDEARAMDGERGKASLNKLVEDIQAADLSRSRRKRIRSCWRAAVRGRVRRPWQNVSEE